MFLIVKFVLVIMRLPECDDMLSEPDKARITEQVREIESHSGVEIVTAFTARCDDYPEIPWKAFALGTTLTSTILAFGDSLLGDRLALSIMLMLTLSLCGGLMLLLLTVVLPSFARLFLGRARAEVEARQYAKELFLRHELFAAPARRAVLLVVARFKESDFNQGIADGVHAVIAILEGADSAVPQPTETETQDNASDRDSSTFSGPDLNWPERILFGGFIFGIIGLFTGVGLFTPGFGWFLYFFLIPFWAMFPMVVDGVTGALWIFCIYLVGFPVAKLIINRRDWYQKAVHDLETKGRTDVGGWTFSSRGSSSSSGGGGFSGGGGRSGGGGASGGW